MKRILVCLVAALAFSIAGAQASVVTFSNINGQNTTFTDGYFSINLSGDYPDGFYGLTTTEAFNGYGQNGESIFFNSPVLLDSLILEKGACCQDTSPISFTASLYDSFSTLLASQTIGATYTPTTLVFNQGDVSQVKLTFAGGSNAYGDGRTVAWYEVSDVTYSSSVPEPSSLFMLGSGMIGVVCYYRSRSGRRSHGVNRFRSRSAGRSSQA